MKRSRFTESQIVRILKEVEGCRMLKDVCCEYGISDATYYIWKAEYGGIEIYLHTLGNAERYTMKIYEKARKSPTQIPTHEGCKM